METNILSRIKILSLKLVILCFNKEKMTPINAQGYFVYFEEDGYQKLSGHLHSNNYSKILILVDEHTHALCLPEFTGALEWDGEFEIIETESGEQNKTIDTCMGIWGALSDLDTDRKALLINLGGGVITDMGGFIASTYKRGIDFINIPTTLLSMVDASVGGKTGVDLGSLKNQIGVINYPEMVVIDPVFLNTLPQRQLLSGFAEMLKHGLIRDAAYWDMLGKLSELKIADLGKLIHTSVAIKNSVVIKDPRENGLRKILNFGHTLGHAIESHFLEKNPEEALLHGEAIAAGMILEAYISNQLAGLSINHTHAVKQIFTEYFGKVDFSETDIQKIIEILKFDKKNSHGNINFVLLENIGEPIIDQQAPHGILLEAFDYYKNTLPVKN